MDYRNDRAIETLSDDPAQRFEYYGRRTHSGLDGERALLFAVLVDALHTYVKTRNANGHRKRAEFNEVDAWIRSRTTNGPFAFENVCESLGFNPDSIRFSLKSPRLNQGNTLRHFRHVASPGRLDSASAA